MAHALCSLPHVLRFSAPENRHAALCRRIRELETRIENIHARQEIVIHLQHREILMLRDLLSRKGAASC